MTTLTFFSRMGSMSRLNVTGAADDESAATAQPASTIPANQNRIFIRPPMTFAPSFDRFPLVRLCDLLIGAGARENALQAVVPLPAGVLEDRIGRPLRGDHQAPWFRPGHRIVDRDVVFQALLASAGEALNHGHCRIAEGRCRRASSGMTRTS